MREEKRETTEGIVWRERERKGDSLLWRFLYVLECRGTKRLYYPSYAATIEMHVLSNAGATRLHGSTAIQVSYVAEAVCRSMPLVESFRVYTETRG